MFNVGMDHIVKFATACIMLLEVKCGRRLVLQYIHPKTVVIFLGVYSLFSIKVMFLHF